MFFQLLAINRFFFICPREGSDNSWPEEIKDKTEKHFARYFVLCKTIKKSIFGGSQGSSPRRQCQAAVLNVCSLHMFLTPLHLAIPLGDLYIEYCYRMLGVEANRPSKVTVTCW